MNLAKFKTRLSNIAYYLDYNMDRDSFKEIEFELAVVERAISDYKIKAKQDKQR